MARRLRSVRVFGVLLLLSACGDDGAPDAGSDGGADASGLDAGRDAGARDAGPPDADPWAHPGCNPEIGVECDGDWAGRCAPACSRAECCSPVGGEFVCVERADDGACPAADIWVDETRIGEGDYFVQWQFFEDDDCAIVEGCVDGPGWRRLLRFATWTPNTGTADLYLGPPEDTVDHFVYSECHDHYHFESYAAYELRDEGGAVVATGHKQAFCLLDFYRYPGTEERGLVYDCDDQGIQRDYQDVYGTDLDCQWVDVTDVAPGDYRLFIELNSEHVLLESDYDNNTAEVPVAIPEDVDVDVTAACAEPLSGDARDCGWVRDSERACTPGATVTLACSGACGLGSCRGDTVLRVCGRDGDPTCSNRRVLGRNDDSGCADDDVCSQVRFACPDDGAYVIFVGGYDSDDDGYACTLEAREES